MVSETRLVSHHKQLQLCSHRSGTFSRSCILTSALKHLTFTWFPNSTLARLRHSPSKPGPASSGPHSFEIRDPTLKECLFSSSVLVAPGNGRVSPCSHALSSKHSCLPPRSVLLIKATYSMFLSVLWAPAHSLAEVLKEWRNVPRAAADASSRCLKEGR